MVPDPSKIGDGHCDSGPYMDLVECSQDGQDCRLFLQRYPNCKVPDPEFVGDGFAMEVSTLFKNAVGMAMTVLAATSMI